MPPPARGLLDLKPGRAGARRRRRRPPRPGAERRRDRERQSALGLRHRLRLHHAAAIRAGGDGLPPVPAVASARPARARRDLLARRELSSAQPPARSGGAVPERLDRACPNAAKAPDAMLKLGISLNALGARDQACATFAELARKYPQALEQRAPGRRSARSKRACAACVSGRAQSQLPVSAVRPLLEPYLAEILRSREGRGRSPSPGGPDSMALMPRRALDARLRRAVPVTVATVDHGLRAESRDEAETVAGWAGRLGLPHRILAWAGEKPRTRRAGGGARGALPASRGARRTRAAPRTSSPPTPSTTRPRRCSCAWLAAPASRASPACGPERSAAACDLGRPLLGLRKAELWRRARPRAGHSSRTRRTPTRASRGCGGGADAGLSPGRDSRPSAWRRLARAARAPRMRSKRRARRRARRRAHRPRRRHRSSRRRRLLGEPEDIACAGARDLALRGRCAAGRERLKPPRRICPAPARGASRARPACALTSGPRHRSRPSRRARRERPMRAPARRALGRSRPQHHPVALTLPVRPATSSGFPHIAWVSGIAAGCGPVNEQ